MICHDITLLLSCDTVEYPGDPRYEMTKISQIKKGDMVNISKMTFASHTGTHIDAPYHFFEDGLTIDKLPIDWLVGSAKVIEIGRKNCVEVDDIRNQNIQKGDFILFKTRNSSFIRDKKFHSEYTYVSQGAAEYIANMGAKAVGIDYMSVDSFDSADYKAHRILLGAKIIIIENIDLNGIRYGEYNIAALPLNVKGGDGSPARVVLFEKG